jgi:transcriptional antiterminator RfaH
MSGPWYILRTATRQEKRACASLKELEVDHYLPCETVERKINRELYPIERPLFPGYLFAQIEDRDFHAAVHANGVHAPVRVTMVAGERLPATVPAAFVEALQDAQARGDFDRTKREPEKPIETGESVIITEGPFAGLIGAFLELRGDDRMALLIKSCIVEVATVHIDRAA